MMIDLSNIVYFLLTIFVLFPTSGFSAEAIHPDCLVHFKRQKAIPGQSDCLWKCEAIPILYKKDKMVTCGGYCKAYCSPKTNLSSPSIADLYPGLTDREREMAAKDPAKMLEAYVLSWKAEKLCLSIYKSSLGDDESDACRHFVWAGLMVGRFGSDFSGQVLEAHEMNPEQPEAEKKMDVKNNKWGLQIGQKMLDSGMLTDENIVEAFKANLKDDKFIILKHRSVP